ncbi:cylicin-1 isoform X1 [Lontra canadensis]|uniref:cylicin-1 isoform X1 n=1 Tax=Lontra canadensis TaxID=76717 RepID=UPI0013F32C9C|nr:cylicin-1 isoform X1 [Lontra canadensis]
MYAGEMSLPRLFLGELINDIQTWKSLCWQEVNIRTNDNSIPINESSGKLWNQDYFTLTFPKPLQPGRKRRSRPSGSQISVPGHDKRKLEEVQKPAHIRIRHSLKKFFQRPSVYLTVRRQAPFINPYTLKAHHENGEPKKSKDDKKGRTLQRNSKRNKSPHETTTEYKMVNDEKPKRGNQAAKTPSKSSCNSELSKDSKSKLEINPESIHVKTVSMYQKKGKRDSKNSKETDNKFTCAKKDSKDSKNNSDARAHICSNNSSSMGFRLYLEESGAECMKCDMWLKNDSQNNSKKTSKKDTKKDAKKSSDAESVDSMDAKKGSKKAKKDSKKSDKKKDAKKDTETTDEDSTDSKDAKKVSKAKKDSKKSDKKKKDAVSTDAESDSELETKKWKKDEKKNKKDSKKEDKKKDAKKDVMSTDADSESEWYSKKGKKDEKKEKRNSKKDDKNKFAMKSEESTETESDWDKYLKDKYDSKKTKKDSKKDAQKQDAKKVIESTDAESDEFSRKHSKKPEKFKSSDAESEESVYKLGAKKRLASESDAASTDSKKEKLELKRESKMSFKKTTFKEKGKKTDARRVPPSRERPPLPPCEPLLPSPKIKRLCQSKMPAAPLKPRYAPLPEAKWIHKLL